MQKILCKIFVAFPFFFILAVQTAMYSQYLINMLPYQPIWRNILFNILVLGAVLALLSTIFTDPGSIPEHFNKPKLDQLV